MDIKLRRASIDDCGKIHSMQISSFSNLLKKYQDYDMSPGAEGLDRVITRMKQSNTDYYCVLLGNIEIGAIRVERLPDLICRIAPMFILPAYQGHGHAKQMLEAIEELYPETKCWILDTIKQESKLCHIYESAGYFVTGKEEVINDNMSIVYYHKLK